MTSPEQSIAPAWPLWQRIGFRFVCVYLILQIAPWNWLFRVPGTRWLAIGISGGLTAAVTWANAHLFHIRPVLVAPNGSGDTSFSWTLMCLYLLVAAIACVVWSVLDRHRASYPKLGYWFRTITRYYIATHALSYGIIKLFLLQMSFPQLSQLATPLGDFLPMRVSWMFIGYSDSYQFFSGAMETIAGLLLLNRRTVTLGLIAATGAFMNVVMINMSYDVPVKLFSSHLLFACVLLLSLDAKRLIDFLVLNRAAPGTHAYDPPFTTVGMRRAALAVKAGMVLLILVLPFNDSWNRYRTIARTPAPFPFTKGVYDVVRYVRGRDTIPMTAADTMRWKDVIFDAQGAGSVNSTDSTFWQRYRRGYFRYRADTAKRTAVFWRTSWARDSVQLFTARYEIPDSLHLRLWAKFHDDSLYVELARTQRHFQLTERQFHWISEYNR